MAANRREFMGRTSAVVAAFSMRAPPAALGATPSPIKAIAFDAFPIFDPRGLAALAGEMCGDVGKELAAQWSAKLFGYTWLATSAERYRDFQSLAACALDYAASSLGVRLGETQKAELVRKYRELDVWPDVRAALDLLKANGIRMRLLSNLGREALASNLARNRLSEYFEAPLSTDLVRRFKPAPEAYAMAVNAFDLPRDRIGFVAFGGWDAVGAAWFGYRTAWINRFGLPAEPIGASPEIQTRGIEGALILAGLA